MRYELGQANRLGNRSSNQDRFCAVETDEGVMLVLGDGLGGKADGEVAAQTLVDCARDAYLQAVRPIANPGEFLGAVIKHAHLQIIAFGQRQVPPVIPGTTAVLCLIQDGDATWAHVGDSRLYIYQQGLPLYRTTDHSYVEELFQSGEISRWEQDTHPKRNQITQCLGCRRELPKVTLSNTVMLKPRDVILLCSDGLWGPLDDSQIGTLLEDHQPLDNAINAIAEKAEKLSYPHSDNISALALRFLSAEGGQGRGEERREQRHNGAQYDPLEDAIAQIEEVISEYEEEFNR
ncbi:MAG: protein phosphatase 2C domain-containing protein [Gammaproteobacteria bacterium]|nr:protein phosphatase 2C domain-containing protein [Gammaproteobacteria bacterium]MCW8972633.1 protein phosphatase 2C domain-containing protein [Gammaproteobacteria bacterium]MCW8992825.1 protein phosphatase 2C domain-containing protein [Gammaproteobacteria bacterium]